MRQRRCRGSITIFTALTMMLVVQLLFTLIESARQVEFEKVIQMNTESVLESVFADYCSPLWEEYHLLGTTATNTEGELSFNNRSAQMCNLTCVNLGSRQGNDLSEGMSLFCADVADIETTSYMLMTDEGGAVFRQLVSAYMEDNLVYELAKGIYNNFESIKESENQFGDGDSKIDDAMDALEDAEKDCKVPSLKKSAPKGENESPSSNLCEAENPLTTVSEAKKSGILNMVLPPKDQLSKASYPFTDKVSKRALEQGTSEFTEAADWYDKTMFTEYVCNYMSSYIAPNSNHAMQYEVEYLIGGKDSDADNLQATITRLLVIREGLNMASLMASPDKQAQAMALATALGGATLNPAIIEAIKYGILAAWAYVESVLDVRTLLDGETIALVKSAATWTSSIDNFPSLLSGWSKAKSCGSSGLNYVQYCKSILLFENEHQLAMRAMEVEEATIRLMDGYTTFRMDHAVCGMEVAATYEYRPFFLTFVSMLDRSEDTCRMIDSAGYYYFKGKEGV